MVILVIVLFVLNVIAPYNFDHAQIVMFVPLQEVYLLSFECVCVCVCVSVYTRYIHTYTGNTQDTHIHTYTHIHTHVHIHTFLSSFCSWYFNLRKLMPLWSVRCEIKKLQFFNLLLFYAQRSSAQHAQMSAVNRVCAAVHALWLSLYICSHTSNGLCALCVCLCLCLRALFCFCV